MSWFRSERQRLRQRLLSGISSLGFFLALLVTASAAPGDLDLSFGGGGKIITTGNYSSHLETIFSMAIQPDGKIVAVGRGSLGQGNDFAVVRYNPNGSLDTSFGGSGIVVTPVGDNTWDIALAVAIQPDGKIIAAGTGALVRYNNDGSLDTLFGSGGKVIASFGIADVALQTDGKIVAAGSVSNDFVVARYNANGSLDASFGSGGTVMTVFNEFQGAAAVAVQADRKILAAGFTGYCDQKNQACFYDSALARYNTNGSLDTSFDGDGIITIDDGIVGGYSAVVIQPNGRIIAAGGDGYGFVVVRYDVDGSPDSSFEFDPFYSSGGRASSVALQSDGRIIVSGSMVVGPNWDFALVRLNTDGSFDTSFDGDGIVTTDLGNAEWANDVAVQTDGKIVVAGETNYGNELRDFALARYQGGARASRTLFDFDGDRRADVSVFRPSDRIWYLNQSSNGFSATQFGLSTDKLTPSDYDGDGRTDISVYRDGTWYWLNSTDNSFNARQFGLASDIPVPSDYYTGGGLSELAVYRNGTWWILNLFNNQINTIQFGLATDKPVPADYDGDGRADQAVYRNGEWHLNRSTQGYSVFNWGGETDRPVEADYDGDGKTDPAIYRDGTWYVLGSLQGWLQFDWGLPSDVPTPADYDGDGKSDPAVYRNGIWYLRQSAGGVSNQQFGLIGDRPIASAHLP